MKLSNLVTLKTTKNNITKDFLLEVTEGSDKCSYASPAEHSLASVCRKLGSYDGIQLVDIDAKVDLNLDVPCFIFKIEDNESIGYLDVFLTRAKNIVEVHYLDADEVEKECARLTYVELFKALGCEKKVTLEQIRA